MQETGQGAEGKKSAEDTSVRELRAGLKEVLDEAEDGRKKQQRSKQPREKNRSNPREFAALALKTAPRGTALPLNDGDTAHTAPDLGKLVWTEGARPERP